MRITVSKKELQKLIHDEVSRQLGEDKGKHKSELVVKLTPEQVERENYLKEFHDLPPITL